MIYHEDSSGDLIIEMSLLVRFSLARGKLLHTQRLCY